jgi:hypothetical protein
MIPNSEPTLPSRARAASHAALWAYPGAIGELLAYELSSWGEFGHRFGSHELVAGLVDHIDELSAARGHDSSPSPRRQPRRHRTGTRTTDIAASTSRLRHMEVRTALYAGLFARRSAHPGPVGEVVSRELDAYIETDMRLAPSALLRRVLDELLALPGAPRPQPNLAKPTGSARPENAA